MSKPEVPCFEYSYLKVCPEYDFVAVQESLAGCVSLAFSARFIEQSVQLGCFNMKEASQSSFPVVVIDTDSEGLESREEDFD